MCVVWLLLVVFVVGCLSCVGCWLLVIVCCVLFVGRCLLLFVDCLLLFVGWFCGLFVLCECCNVEIIACCMLCRLLFVVYCLLYVWHLLESLRCFRFVLLKV